MDKDEINEKIRNTSVFLNSLGGFEIICESLVNKIYSVFGKNMLLSMLYQIGSGPGEIIANRLKSKYNKENFEVIEAFEVLTKEVMNFYSIQIREIEKNDNTLRFVIENRCFLRESIKYRDKLNYGSSLCRINKGYFESAYKMLIGDKLKKIEINFIENDPVKDVCIEELIFYF